MIFSKRAWAAAMMTLLSLGTHSTVLAAPESTAAIATTRKKEVFDVPALIKRATAKYQGKFKLSEKQAVAQMDDMLIRQYASGGRIVAEKNAYLKSLYYQGTTLILNGYPIAGGTVVSIARSQPAYNQSPGGQGLANFVDAMLAPSDEEDAELAQYLDRTKKAQAILRALRPELQLVAQIRVIGAIYNDDIAVDGGKLGLDLLGASAAERKIVDQALGVK